jgi:hypothetical protein
METVREDMMIIAVMLVVPELPLFQNMFQTLKYLTIVGAVTFIAGNKMLRKIANSNKQ